MLFTSSQSSADPDDTFDYSNTVALILKAEDGGGHIFQRPERYDPANAFVTSFAIVYQYTSQMQSAHSNLALDMNSLQPQYSFLLVNHQSTKLLHLGDHWLGDENMFAVMEPADYQNLKRIFDVRRQVSKPTQEEAQKVYIKEIHDLWQEDSEEFYRRYYFPERKPPVLIDNPASFSSQSVPAISTEPTETIDSNSSSRARETSDIETTSNISPVDAGSSEEKINYLHQIFWLCAMLVFIAGLWWWQKRQ